MKTLISKTLTLFLSFNFFFVSMSFAAEGPYSNSSSVAGLGTATQLVQGISGMMLSLKRQQLDLLNQANSIQNQKGDLENAKYFPDIPPGSGCLVAPSNMSYPANACSPTSMTSSDAINAALSLAQTAAEKTQLLEHLTNDAAKDNLGVACLQRKKSEQLNALQDKINSIENINNQIKSSQELYKSELTKQQEYIKSLNDELNGTRYAAQAGNGNGGQAARLQREFEKDPNCRAALTSSFYEKGLRGIRDIMKVPPRSGGGSVQTNISYIDQAKNLLENQNAYKSELENLIRSVQGNKSSKTFIDSLQNPTQTVSAVLKGDLGNSNVAKRFQAIVGNQINSYKEKFNALYSSFSYLGLNYSIPNFINDPSAGDKLSNFVGGAKDYFEQSLVNDCVNNQSIVGFDVKAMSSNLKQNANNSISNSSTAGTYANKLTNVLTDDSFFIESKVKTIKNMDSTIGDNTVYVELRNGNSISKMTPGKAIEQAVALCRKYINSSASYEASTDTKNTSNQYTGTQKAARAQQILNDILTLDRSAMNSLTSDIREELIECSSRSSKGVGQCADGRVDSSSSNFCLKSSLTCATSVSLCYKKTESAIAAKETEARNASISYNRMIEQYHNQVTNYLGQIQSQVYSDMNFYKTYFQNAQWELPEDIFSPLPTASRPKPTTGLGEELLYGGGENIEQYFKTTTDQLDGLKESFEKQRNAVAGELDNYITSEMVSIEKNKAKWEEVFENCKLAIDQALMAQQQAQAEQEKAIQEAQGKANEFCSKYNGLMGISNPLGGCDEASKLYDEAVKISSQINPEVITSLRNYKDLCDTHQGEKKSKGGSNEKQSKKEKDEGFAQGLGELCKDNGMNWKSVLSTLTDDLFSERPPSCKGSDYTEDELRENLDSGTVNLPDDCDGTWARNYKRLADLYKEGKSRGNSLNGDQSRQSVSSTPVVLTSAEIAYRDAKATPGCNVYYAHLENLQYQYATLRTSLSQVKPDNMDEATTTAYTNNLQKLKETVESMKRGKGSCDTNNILTDADLDTTIASLNSAKGASSVEDLDSQLKLIKQAGEIAQNYATKIKDAQNSSASQSSSAKASSSLSDVCQDLERIADESYERCRNSYNNDPLKQEDCSQFNDMEKVATKYRGSLDSKIKQLTKSNSSSTEKADEESAEDFTELGEDLNAVSCQAISTMSPSNSIQQKTGISGPYDNLGSSSLASPTGVNLLR